MTIVRAFTLGMVITSFACGDDGGGGTTTFTTAPTGGSGPSTGDDSSGQTDSGDSGDGGTTQGGSGDGDDSASEGSGGAPTSGDSGDASGGGSTSGGDMSSGGEMTTGGDMTTGGGGANMCPADMGDRPETGQYSCCAVNDMMVTGCGTAPNNLCLNVEGLGYCTNTTCADAAMDCDPAPGSGTATPICVEQGDNNSCALDCSSGDCPAGMTCRAVSFEMGGTVYNICL